MLGTAVEDDNKSNTAKTWSQRYGVVHRLQRVDQQSVGFPLPKRVRIYRRRNHFVMQWWDPTAKQNLNQRVEGDIVTAVAKAREIDDKLSVVRHSGVAPRIGLLELINLYLADLELRANGGEIAPATCQRLRSALAHLEHFIDQPLVAKSFPWAHSVDRSFRLAFSSFLQSHRVAPNGHPHATYRLLRDPDFVLDACRSLFAWASDPERGNLLPNAFSNPFQNRGGSTTSVREALVGNPDITIAMAVDLLQACDVFQLPLFGTLALYGLRPSEITYVFREHVDDEWLKVSCIPDLGYFTKGRRNKQFPIVPALQSLWSVVPGKTGLLFTRRDWQAPGAGDDVCLASLKREFDQRCRIYAQPTAAAKQVLRDQLVLDAGSLNYDRIEHEFARLARSLGWPRAATLKDLRHLFSTCLENAGVPEFYRRYLMGHSPGRAPIVSYTHLDAISKHFQRALDSELAPCVRAIEQRGIELQSAAPLSAAPTSRGSR